MTTLGVSTPTNFTDLSMGEFLLHIGVKGNIEEITEALEVGEFS